jgi:nicotinamidase-related amidase
MLWKGKVMADLLIDSNDSLLIVIDVQKRLWPHIANKEEVRDRCRVLMEGAAKIGVPVIVSEQYPKGLGETIDELMEAKSDDAPLCEKVSFGCLDDEGLTERIESYKRRQLVLCGIETHVCVMQTALQSIEKGLQVAVVADAVGSRVEGNRQLALDRIQKCGGTIVGTEMILFEWMRTAKHPSFKEVSKLVK